MTAPRQLPLDLGHRPALSGADFLVAPCNAAAVAWLDRWPGWPGPALVLHGPAGCGKTHLVNVFLARTRGRLVVADELLNLDPTGLLLGARTAAVDNAEDLVAAGLEEALLHLYNVAREGGRHLLLTAERPPARWAIGLADLRSRLVATPAAGIGPPDDAALAAVLVKLFADRQIAVDEAVIRTLTGRMERSFDSARRLVAAIDRAALAERRKVTPALARRVVEEDRGGGDDPPRPPSGT